MPGQEAFVRLDIETAAAEPQNEGDPPPAPPCTCLGNYAWTNRRPFVYLKNDRVAWTIRLLALVSSALWAFGILFTNYNRAVNNLDSSSAVPRSDGLTLGLTLALLFYSYLFTLLYVGPESTIDWSFTSLLCLLMWPVKFILVYFGNSVLMWVGLTFDIAFGLIAFAVALVIFLVIRCKYHCCDG